MKRVLALQNAWDDPPGYLGEIMDEHGIAFDVVQVEDEAIPDMGRYDALIALGGPQHVHEDEQYPYLAEEKALLHRVVEENIPYLGICLGGQLLASALGAKVSRHHLTEMGFFEVQLTEEGRRDPLFKGLPGYQQVIQWHEDIFDLPAGAVRLATSEHTPDQAFRYGQRAYGLQYHIEVTPEMLDTWLRYPDYRKEVVKLPGQEGADSFEQERLRRYPIYREHSRIMFENFLRISGCL